MYDLQMGSAPWLRAAAIYLRMQVFVLERTIKIEDEFDKNDVPGVVYAVIFDGKEPVATGRFLREGDDAARLTRIATRRPPRPAPVPRSSARSNGTHRICTSMTCRFMRR
ncbi:hypothetical protein [Lacticaseibacillus sharpeae]|uniref:hypothetical protein n=1 Tax=Lacticaseibacillus sharpeae TaxID=1626 RepID=UPI000AC07539|nr:hypothetical protein [Lacticaseibacillus sharpeae]